jgi:hypothetical protein
VRRGQFSQGRAGDLNAGARERMADFAFSMTTGDSSLKGTNSGTSERSLSQ